MRIIVAASLLSLSPTVLHAAGLRIAVPPFERLSRNDAEVRGMLWTGDSSQTQASRVPAQGDVAMSMSDNGAAVKREGRYIALRPAPSAENPPHLEHWTGKSMAIDVCTPGREIRAGRASDQSETLSVIEAGRTTTHAGTLNCGA